jgi:hypothetical protein
MLRRDEPIHVGALRTDGVMISLPYCRYSAVDIYADVTLCNLDLYDVSGDNVRFIETRAENPDLDAVARLVEYARTRDLPAVRAYTTDDKTAALVLQRMPSSYHSFMDRKVTPAGPDKETVLLRNGARWRFELVKTKGRWLISDFVIEP